MALVRKILETTLTAGSTSVTFTDTDIPNSLLRVYCTKASLFPLSQTLSGNSLSVNYKPQDTNIGVALEIVKQGLDIVDDLLSEDATKALSANQGKVLKDTIDGLTAPALTELSDVDFTSLTDGDMIVYDSVSEKFVNQSIPSIPSNITDLDDVNVSDIQSGQVLAWDETAQKFVNVNQSGGGSSEEYSTTEQKIGKWIDGTDLFMKTVNFGALPNNNQKATAHSISNLKNFIDISGVASGASGTSNRFPLPYIDTNQLSNGIGIYADNTNITIRTGSDRSSYSAYVTLKYTKTS